MSAVSPPVARARTATMRSAIVAAPGVARITSVPVPEVGPGEIRIRIEGCGVCGSNLPVWDGRPWFTYPGEPGAPGHEGWGLVDSVGDGVEGIVVGERVATLSTHAFAEYDVAAAASAVVIPPVLAEHPFPGEPLACAMNAFRRAEVRPGHTVVVIGIGFLGALLTALSAAAGARVIALSRRSFALEIARTMGAAVTIPLDDHASIVRQVGELTDGAGADRVFEAVGQQWPLDLAGELTRVRGRLLIAGYHQDGRRSVDLQLWNWRGLDVVNAHEREPAVYVKGMREAVAAVADGRLDPRPLYTHRYGLDELGTAMDAMRERPDGFLKALVAA